MTKSERQEVRRQAFKEAIAACETRIVDIDAIFPNVRSTAKQMWVALLRREPRECIARIRAIPN